MVAEQKKKRYESQRQTVKRAEVYYPSEPLKNELNAYMMDGESKSELAVRLLKSFFAARKKEGRYPTTINILPH